MPSPSLVARSPFVRRIRLAPLWAVPLFAVADPSPPALSAQEPGARVITLTDTLPAGTGGMEVDASGRIYMSDFGRTLQGPPGEAVWRIQPTGEAAVWALGLEGASGNAFDGAGRFLQSNIATHVLSRIAPDGGVETFADEGLRGPVGIAVTTGDTLFVASCGGHRIDRVDPDGTVRPFAETELLRCPNGITLAGDGHLYVANFGNGDVVRIAPDGTAARFVTLPGGNNGHILWGNDVLYVVARGANQLYQVTLDGEVTLLAGTGERGLDDGPALEATLSLPNDIALSPDGGTLYFNDVARLGDPPQVIAPAVVRALILPGAGGR